MTQTSLITGGNKLKVLFKCVTHDSTPVVVSGDIAELGSWDLGQALRTVAQKGANGTTEWVAQIELPLGRTVEYKFVKQLPHGVHWESGNNHRITVIPSLHTLNSDFRD